jgi:hypothetical protein
LSNVRWTIANQRSNNKIDGWKHHVVHTLRQYGIVPLDIEPKFRFTQQVLEGRGKKQRLNVQFGEEAPWIVENSVYIRKNGVTVDSGKDGSVVPIPHEPDCFCNNDASKDDVHVMGCCGKKVHVLCLVGYIHSIPFCMYCSASLNVSYKTLLEQTISLPMSQQSPTDEAEPVIESSIINKEAKEASMSKEAIMSNDASAAIPLCQEIATMTNNASGKAEEERGEEEGGDERNSSSSPLKEDILRNEARDKKRKMQAISAEKEMKRRGECLVAEGLGVGAVLTLKVDYRTHSHEDLLLLFTSQMNTDWLLSAARVVLLHMMVQRVIIGCRLTSLWSMPVSENWQQYQKACRPYVMPL